MLSVRVSPVLEVCANLAQSHHVHTVRR